MQDWQRTAARGPASESSHREIEGSSRTVGVGASGGAAEDLARKSAHLEFLYGVAAQLLVVAEVNGFVDVACQRLATLLNLAAYFHFRTSGKSPGALRLVSYS